MKTLVSLRCALVLFVSLAEANGPSLSGSAHDPSPAAMLARAREVMGFARAGNRVLHAHAIMSSEQNYESDRTYPPFFSSMNDQEIWFDPSDAVLRVESRSIFPGTGPTPVSVTIDDGKNAEAIRGGRSVAIARRQEAGRELNAWAVIADWSAANDVRFAGTETYRDYPRLVLAHKIAGGEQKLYIDPKSGFPVKLDFIEPHYLWGQRHIEYLWSTWTTKDGMVSPGAAFRVADGDVELSQTIGNSELIARDRAPSLGAPQTPAHPPADLPMFLQPISPQAVKVSPDLYLLSNPGYNEAVASVNGEVYVFDATQGEKRARQDAEQIAKLFPGQHKVNLVVTDLAWPHIAGVRYWVSQGATIIAHEAACNFLQMVVDRSWTLTPDALEQMRSKDPATVRMKCVAVNHAMSTAAGRLQLLAIDGIGSEVALMIYVPAEKFLWGSDYIQTMDEPSLYASEVLHAAKTAGIRPEQVAAEHLSLTDWKLVESAQLKSTEHGAQ